MFRPRPSQEPILAYHGGRMGVSAVPGAGKTHVLSALAAKLVATGIDDDQEVLIVTMVNSAVENIKARVGGFVGGKGLLANIGYRVATGTLLDFLSVDIVDPGSPDVPHQYWKDVEWLQFDDIDGASGRVTNPVAAP